MPKTLSTSVHRAKGKALAQPRGEMPPVKVDRNGFTRCRVCGCTEMEACNPPCSWVDEDLCSNCGETVEAMVEWAEAAHRSSLFALLREFKRVRESVHSRPARKAKRGGA